MVEQLIAAGAGLDLKDNNGYGPIHATAMPVRYPSRAADFLGRGTALTLASGEGHALVVEQLISAGAGLDLKTNDGYGPIYPAVLAVRYPSRQPIRAGALRSCWPRGRVTRSWSSSSLPPAPASISRATMGTSQYTRLPRLCAVRAGSRLVGRYTALISAAAGGHTDIIAALIFAGADVDVSNNVGYGTHRRGFMSAVAQALERTSPGQGDRRGRLRSRRQVGAVR